MGASSVSSNHGKYVFKHYIEGVPFVDAPDFLPALGKLVQAEKIDFIYPAHDSVLLKLVQHRAEIPCEVVGPPVDTCTTCRSKGATYAAFKDIVRTPMLFESVTEDIPFPVFLKPDRGQGSRGVWTAHTRKELEVFLERDPSLLVIEYLPGPEYTVDCFTDRHGALRFVGARERVRIRNGISTNTRPVEADPEFTVFAERINETLAFRGAWFFQVKRNRAGALTLMEIAPRISGGMGLYRNRGVNLPLLTIYDLVDLDLEVKAQDFAIEMDRALCCRYRLGVQYEHVYIDLDDTLVLDGQVNVLAVAFLHQCRNRGIKVHLVTRHAGDVAKTLRAHALEHFFDSITSLDELTCKSTYIKADNAIFIDDSYVERKRVHNALGMPTFGVDAIESLIDWRR